MPTYLFEVCGLGAVPLDEMRRDCADDTEAAVVAEELLRGLLATRSDLMNRKDPAVAFFFTEDRARTMMLTLGPDGRLRRLSIG